MENMFLSFLESKILLWKVNFHIYFPQWQVMSKVSVKPCNGCRVFANGYAGPSNGLMLTANGYMSLANGYTVRSNGLMLTSNGWANASNVLKKTF